MKGFDSEIVSRGKARMRHKCGNPLLPPQNKAEDEEWEGKKERQNMTGRADERDWED